MARELGENPTIWQDINRGAPTPLLILSMAGGVVAGEMANSGPIGHLDQYQGIEGQIGDISRDNQTINHLLQAKTAAGNTAIHGFLKNQELDNAQKMTALRGHEPAQLSGLEQDGLVVGGAVGVVVAATLFTVAARRVARRIRGHSAPASAS